MHIYIARVLTEFVNPLLREVKIIVLNMTQGHIVAKSQGLHVFKDLC